MNHSSKPQIIKEHIPYILNPELIQDSNIKIRASIQNGISYVSISDIFLYMKISKKKKPEFINENECLMIYTLGPYPRSHKFFPLESIISIFRRAKKTDAIKNFLENIDRHNDSFPLIIQLDNSIQNKKIKIEEKDDDEYTIAEEDNGVLEKRIKHEIRTNLIQFMAELNKYDRKEKCAISEFISMVKNHNVDFDKLSKILNGNII